MRHLLAIGFVGLVSMEAMAGPFGLVGPLFTPVNKRPQPPSSLRGGTLDPTGPLALRSDSTMPS